MENNENTIFLHSTDVLVTSDSSQAYHVAKGTVKVFMAPSVGGQTGRQLFLCDVEENGVVPGFAYTDPQYRSWCFVIKSDDDAEVRIMTGVTKVLIRNFIRRTRITNYEKEGFETSLVDYYERELLRDEVIMDVNAKDTVRVSGKSGNAIRAGLDVSSEQIASDVPLYRAVAFACAKSNIAIESEDKIISACGNKTFTVKDIAVVSRFGCRDVVLEPDWYQSDCGTIISFLEGQPVACIPKGQTGYTVYYGEEERSEKLTKEIAAKIEPKASCILRTLPGKELTEKDIFSFCVKSLRKADIRMVCLLGLAGALIGILLPTLNQKIYDDYIPLGNISQLVQLCAIIATLMIGNLFFDMVRKLSEYRLGSRIGIDLQNAAYYKVFRLPESFFRNYESADLAQRMGGISNYAKKYTEATLITGISTVFSLLYLYRMFKYAKKLSWIALLMLLVFAGIMYLVSIQARKHEMTIEKRNGEASSKLFQFITGIEKIRMAGVEDRAAFEYVVPFAEKENAAIKKNRFTAATAMLSGVVSTIFSIFFYLMIVKAKLNLTTGNFMAFNSAFGSFSAAVIALVQGLIELYELRPQYDRFKDILTAATEDSGECEVPGRLEGNISLRDVKFAYSEGSPNVLNGISLDIRSGDYVGIVGSSGCGKSTLLKLLLGFEQPTSGQILYDNKDLRALDKRELRKNLGVVLQNGKLISGSIYENITITAPGATMKDVNRVIEAVGLKADIAQMPMGIHTVLGENSGTISGGQQQRILIARAIISNPSILIFDEATSALDNLTQAAVTSSLDKMNVTRVVVAHRLSTIQKCNPIIVLDKGVIAEKGSYKELMEKKGLFYQLAIRQLVDDE